VGDTPNIGGVGKTPNLNPFVCETPNRGSLWVKPRIWAGLCVKPRTIDFCV